MRVLFVCLGNICRSPTAEAVFRAKAAAAGLEAAADSAGLGDWHRGRPPYPPAVRAAAARGYDLSGLHARLAGRADFSRFDLILAADAQNRSALERLRPAGVGTPVRLLLDCAPGSAGRDVPDPYFTGDFDAALDVIEAAVDGLVATLCLQSGTEGRR